MTRLLGTPITVAGGKSGRRARTRSQIRLTLLLMAGEMEPAEVAAMLDVDLATVQRWVAALTCCISDSLIAAERNG